MSNLTINQKENQLVVDSRLVAEELGIDHKSFVRTLRNHQTTIESTFGVLRFENAKPPEGSQGGRPESFCWLIQELPLSSWEL